MASQKTESQKTGSMFNNILYSSGICIVIILVAIFLTLLVYSFPSIKGIGLKFLTGTTWDPVFGDFGCLPFLVGTFVTAFLAILISTPFSLAISLSLGEYFRGGRISYFLKSIVELLAGIPSVIYGFWGLFILSPLVRIMEIKLGVIPYGVGIFTTSLILSIMVIPFSASIGSEIINLVPHDLKEAAYSLGATRYEVIRRIILPYSRSGIFAGILLALGRAIGETMAVTMVIGNSNALPKSIFSPANTMASLIANEFTEATERIYLSVLIEIGLLLFVVTAIVSIISKYIIKKMAVEAA